MSLKIGDKVRNIHDDTEGIIVYSTFGASISGVYKNEKGEKVHFQTLGTPIHRYESDWIKIEKFEYNMKEYN